MDGQFFGKQRVQFIHPGTYYKVSAGGGTPTIVTKATSTGNQTTPTLTLPASIVAGNKLLILIGTGGSMTLTTPSGFTLVGHATSGGTAVQDRRMYVWEKVSASGSEGSTLGFTVSGSSAWVCVAYQVSGSATSTGYAGTTGVGTNPDPPNNNPGSSASTLWICGAVKREAVDASAAPSGYSNLSVIRDGSNMSGMASDKTATASSDDPGTFSGFSASDNYATVTTALRA